MGNNPRRKGMETLILNPNIEEIVGLAIYITNIKEFKKSIIEQKAKRKTEVRVEYNNTKKEFLVEEFLSKLGFEIEELE
jgi:hypothetical protein